MNAVGRLTPAVGISHWREERTSATMAVDEKSSSTPDRIPASPIMTPTEAATYLRLAELGKDNPLGALDHLVKTKQVHRSDVDKTLAYLPSPVKDMIELQWLCGMRSSEVTAMRMCDIDTTGKVWMYQPSSHKNEHHGIERVIALGPQAKAIIQRHLKPDLSAFLFSPKDAMRERYASCKTHRNKPNTSRKTDRKLNDRYTSTTYRRAIKRAIDKANEKAKNEADKVHQWTPHQLRHACATRIRKEYGLEAARVILGHTKASTTEVYAEIDHDKARQIMAKVG